MSKKKKKPIKPLAMESLNTLPSEGSVMMFYVALGGLGSSVRIIIETVNKPRLFFSAYSAVGWLPVPTFPIEKEKNNE